MTDDMEALYPFLYSQSTDLDAVMSSVRQSTVEKIDEIVTLRRTVLMRDGDRIAACAEAMAEAFAAGARLFAFGNGGSSTDAQDVATLFMNPGGAARPLPAFALTADVAVVTALANDIGFEVVFARQLAASAFAGDIALGLSTSGNSRNLIAAFEEADRRGMLTVGLAGYGGGQMAELGTIDHLFVVPSASVHRIQEAQTTVYHALWELTQQALTRTEAGDGDDGP
ncbi:phosphoheptose isomerase [Microbispora rosea subsp. aerata]|nr:SIS domain-containing protein [Microbispora rosea]GGO17818.1 phosphoheptose isomerase [Microbispora rosea subsp. aerata]GIH56613.1 phosphoheptose isomerase [Microbispora rosea subsp. aerata]GLJ81858.1 phosphoheptose isomerase [Microbispora rosea subsp. aerata]